jgi:rRNA-processing protein FCF1
MEVLLDTNFIISCIKRKIDFLSELENLGFKIHLPREVYQELKDVRQTAKGEDKQAINIALELFEKKKVAKGTLTNNASVDQGLIDKGRKGYYIATLDAGIKRQIKNRVIINNAKNCVEIERD